MQSHKTLALAVGVALSACGPKVTLLEVKPGLVTLTRKGEGAKLVATAKDAEGKEVKEGVTLAFASSDPSVATVDPASGAVSAVATGDATIAVTFQDKKGEARIKVSIPASLTIAPAQVNLSALGAKAHLSVKVLDAKGREVAAAVSFANPNEKIVSVDRGDLTAVGPGEGEITVSAAGVSSKVKVNVTLPAPAEVTVEKAVLQLKVGVPARIVATAKDESKQSIRGAVLTFASSNEKVAKVDAAGIVTAVGKGKAKVTVAAGAKKAEVEVKVK
jgi:uncharacterized protein YjdB